MYNEQLWDAWVKEELQNYEITKTGRRKYKKKGYLHLDHRYWFPEYLEEIKSIIKGNLIVKHPHTNNYQYFSFSPFLKLLIKTPRYRYQFEEGHYDLETKIRPICLTSHKDSLIIGYYSYYITKIYEEYIKNNDFDNVVLAYRSDLGHCNIQFAKEVFGIIKNKKNCSAMALDIKGYFDHIDHSLLLQKWKQVMGGRLDEDQFRLYKILTEYSYINCKSILKKYKGPRKRNEKLPIALMDIIPGSNVNEKFKKLKRDGLIITNDQENEKTNRKCGIPQGSPISALLSNIFLIDFDAELKRKSELEDFIYRRYCDDILIVCDTDKATGLMDWIVKKISDEYFLTIQPDKVDLIDFHKNTKGQIRGFRRPHRNKQIVGSKPKVTIKDKPAVTNAGNEQKFYKPLQYLGFEYNGKEILIRSSSVSRFFWKLNYRLQRTVVMSYSPNTKSNQIFMSQIYERYTHIGTRNFLTYSYKAAKNLYEEGGIMKQGLNSPGIKKQLRNHFALLRHELSKKNIKWFSHKQKRKKKVTPNYFK